MDRITIAMFSEFVSLNGLQALKEEEAFEHFTGYLITSNHYSESISTDDIHVGAGGDCGIDCIAIIVNGSIVTEPEEVEDLLTTNGYLDVSMIFIQAERSSSFETTKIGQFGFGVQDILAERPKLTQNDEIKQKHRIINKIFSHSSKFLKGNPQCFLYYVTTGKWCDDRDLTVRKDAIVLDLEGLGLFRKVSFECIDAERLQQLYRNTKSSITREILFMARTVVPDIAGVEQAYIGLLPATEFLKLIENDTGEMVTSIFYDNVRHWQEWNPVNLDIKETIENHEKQIYFPLYNNGVTIVAKRIIPTGNRVVIIDYQIVNGCQTSYVLHETRDALNQNVYIPIRLIATEDIEIKNSIIKATNRQTEVPEEQLFALSDFPKKLEAYFPTFDGNKKLYYERRSRQYSADDSIEKVRVINMIMLTRAFASMFLELPHRTTRNYKALLQTLGKDILNETHVLEMYYVAAYAHYRLEYLFRSQALPSIFKFTRYQLLMTYRLIAKPERLPPFNSGEMIRFCNELMATLWDESMYKDIFQRAAQHISTLAADTITRDNINIEPFTEKIITSIIGPRPGQRP